MQASSLHRFIEAQENTYAQALKEIRSGYKEGHWMWFIFPQIKGLGISYMSKYYALKSQKEAVAYLSHPVLGVRIREITEILLQLKSDDAFEIFGSPDDMKLKSCMTLFAIADEDNHDSIFNRVIDKYFDGRHDEKTLLLLENI